MIESFLIGIASGFSVEALKGFSRVDFTRVWGAVPAVFNDENLFSLQRGAYRSVLRATLYHIDELNRECLADLDLNEKDVYIPRPETRYLAHNRLKSRLQKGITLLTYNEPGQKLHARQAHVQKCRDFINQLNFCLSLDEINSITQELLTKEELGKPNAHIDWSEVSNSPLARLTSALVELALGVGEWSAERSIFIRNLLEDKLFGSQNKWYKTFALCFLEEISLDTVLYRQTTTLKFLQSEQSIESVNQHITMLENNLSVKLTDIKLEFASSCSAIKALIGEWRYQYELDDKRVFSPLEPGNHSAYSEMYFATEKDEFVGREDVISQIQDGFLSLKENSPKFGWLALTGEAGTGKSRLAFELISRFREHWPIAGFVKAKFVIDAHMERIQPAQIWGPTILVIDYASRFINQTLKLLERCWEIADKLEHPIRVILIMRRANELLFNTLKNGSDYGGVYNARFPEHANRDRNRDGIIQLGELGDDEVLQLMLRRLEGCQYQFDNEQLLNHLRHYDRRKRPLIAALVADAIRYNTLPSEKGGSDVESNRLQLLYVYLSRNYQNHWQYSAEQQSPGELSKRGNKEIDKHITLVLLATMVRGVTDTSLDSLYEDMPSICQQLLPNRPGSSVLHNDDIDVDEAGILATILGTQRATIEEAYPPLEPDLVGECMVLHFLLDQTEGICPPNSTLIERGRESLTEMAWRCDPDGAAYFSSMLAQDFPDSADKLNWLLPSESKLVSPFSRSLLIRNVVAGIISEWRSHQVSLATLKRLEKLLGLFRYAKSHPKAARQNTAESLSQISLHLAKLINTNLVLPEKSLSQWEDKSDKATTQDKVQKTRLTAAKNKSTKQDKVKSSMAAFKHVSNLPLVKISHADIETKFLNSDQEIVQYAIKLQIRILKLAVRHLYKEQDFDIRDNILSSISWALVSALWSERHKKDCGGSARYSLDEKELALRTSIYDTCLQTAELKCSWHDLATSASLLSNLLYAESGLELSPLDRVYQIIKAKIVEPFEACHTLAEQRTLAFFVNYLWLQIKLFSDEATDRSISSLALRNNILQSFFTAKKIFERLHSTKLNIETQRKSLSSLCSCYARLIGLDCLFSEEQNNKFTEDCWQFLFPHFLDSETLTLSKEELNLIMLLSRQPHLSKNKSFKENVSAILRSAEFSQSSFSVNELPIRLQFIRWLVLDHGVELELILDKFISQVGVRAELDLLEVIIDNIPNSTIHEMQVDNLIAILRLIKENDNCNSAKLEACILHLWSQYLLLDKPEKMAESLLLYWPDGEGLDHNKSRILAFKGIELLSKWTSPLDSQVLQFIPKIKELLRQDSFTSKWETPIAEQEIHQHHIYLVQLISEITRLGLSRGENVEIYLDLMGKTNGK